jgi:multisubunit Na+/H+ antiporter MnhB subunit
VSPKAIELDPKDPGGPEPWADPGNSVAAPGLGFSVAASGLLSYGLAIFAIPVAVAGTILSAIGYRRLKQGETRRGRIESVVGLAVGVGSLLIAIAVVIAVAATS